MKLKSAFSALQVAFFLLVVGPASAAVLPFEKSACQIDQVQVGALSAPGTAPKGLDSQASSQQEVRLVQLNPAVAVEQLTGSAAVAHMQGLKSRQRGALAQAEASLRARGFEPTTKVFVERTIQLASSNSSDNAPRMRRAQDYSEQNNEGEIMFWSWSDGDDNTWEGLIYVEVYGPGGGAATWEGQIDASNEEHLWNFVEVTWSSSNTDDEPLQKAASEPSSNLQLASVTPVPVVPWQHQTLLVKTWLQRAQDWRRCVIAGCAGAAVACIASNGAWAACWGASCVGVEVACAISVY